MGKIRLSHSSSQMYQTCPKKWELHYKVKLRSTKIGSPLFFGAAIDEALNCLLLQKKQVLNDEDKQIVELTPEEAFLNSFKNVRIGKETVDIRQSESAMYFKSDLDMDLLEPQDIKAIQDFADTVEIVLPSYGDFVDFINECQELMKKELDTDTQKVYNYTCWLSLYRKGLMLLEAYNKDIMPQIEEVYDVQKRISLQDGDDEFVGVIDVICSFFDEPGVKYICDNKTSSRPYKQDSVSTSEQLSGYAEAEGINRCAYIVMEKKLRKREPRVRCSIIKDTIANDVVDQTFDKLTEVFHDIQDEKFDKDMDACYTYGQRCAYYQNCRTGSLKDLKYMEVKNGDKSPSNK